MYNVWLIRKENSNGSYSYYSHVANGFPEWVTGRNSRENAKHFKTEGEAKKVFEQISIYTLGSKTDIITAKVQRLK